VQEGGFYGWPYAYMDLQEGRCDMTSFGSYRTGKVCMAASYS
jgi:glucose/arabinose dehydrogenase